MGTEDVQVLLFATIVAIIVALLFRYFQLWCALLAVEYYILLLLLLLLLKCTRASATPRRTFSTLVEADAVVWLGVMRNTTRGDVEKDNKKHGHKDRNA